MHLVGLAFQVVEVPFDAIPVLAAFLSIPLQHPVLLLRAEGLPWLVKRNAGSRCVFCLVVLTFVACRRLPRLDRAASQRLALVRDHQVVVHADHAAESPARIAGTQWGVEGEMTGRRFLIG